MTEKIAKAPTEHGEGPDAARRFEHTMNRLLRVSKDELTKREADYKKSRRAQKNRSGKSV